MWQAEIPKARHTSIFEGSFLIFLHGIEAQTCEVLRRQERQEQKGGKSSIGRVERRHQW